MSARRSSSAMLAAGVWLMPLVVFVQEETSRKFLRQLDKDEDGRVSRREWNGSGSTFLKFDLDLDGYLTADELAGKKPQASPKEKTEKETKDDLEAEEVAIGLPPPASTDVLDRSCTACHNLDRIFMSRQSAHGWEDLVTRMRAKKDAMISDVEAKEVVSYLKELRGKALAQARDYGTARPLDEWAAILDGGEPQLFDRDQNDRLNGNELQKLLWDRLDFDADGQLNAGEFELMPVAADRAKAFAKFDRNHDGRVSPAEFGSPAALLAVADADGDGSLSVDELPRARPGPYRLIFAESVEQVMRKLDRNRDGKLNDKELRGEDEFISRFDSGGDRMLDAKELEAALADSRARGVRVAFDDFISRYDMDGDHKVDRDEFVGPERSFERLDRDGDGSVTEKDGPGGVRGPDVSSEGSRRWRK